MEKQCEINKLGLDACENEAYANITVSGDKNSVTLEVCVQHLDELEDMLPTYLSETAKQQLH